MKPVSVDNLGIPPLAGLCDYEAAGSPGYEVKQNVSLLRRYIYLKSRLVELYSAHIAHTPEWEVKCAFGLHMWLDAEHSAALRKRVSEMREPPLDLDKVPDEQLKLLMDEAIHSGNTVELLVAIYGVIKPKLLSSLQRHYEETNPIADHPTRRMLRILILEEEEIIAWGAKALKALTSKGESADQAERWRRHIAFFLEQCGGVAGDSANGGQSSGDHDIPQRRSDGTRYRMDPVPVRDSRFVDPFNGSALIDDYYRDENLNDDERGIALYAKRLREMDVPEWMAPILYEASGKPWEFYLLLSRQLWDETRHAMLGEIGLVMNGVPFYKYPIDIRGSTSLNTEMNPLDAHVLLWGIEQGLMNKETGKRLEWEISKQAGMPHISLMQDYDWADEVLHAQIGKKLLLPQFASMKQLKAHTEQANIVCETILEKMLGLSKQEQWWPALMEDIREYRRNA